MRPLMAFTAILGLLVLACGDGPSTCSEDTDIDCENACEHMTQFCKENCGGSQAQNCADTGCVAACELYRKDASSIPGSRPELVLGNFNCADDNDSCGDFAGCVSTCFALHPD